MPEANQTKLRVAILTTPDKAQPQFKDLLQEAGLNVVINEITGSNFLIQLEKSPADVLLVETNAETDHKIDVIDILLEYDLAPVFFHDSTSANSNTNALWAKKLVHKLTNVVRTHHSPEKIKAPLKIANKPQVALKHKVITSGLSPESLSPPKDAATSVWVLGASLGGPQAVRQFLSCIKADLPVTFLLAQHIGTNHILLLAEQLNRTTPFKVISGTSGHFLRHHEVVVIPTDKNISITHDGYLSLSPISPNTIYSPCIDNIMTTVAQRYGQMAGAIVFSGMGDDGANGCKAMAYHSGIVWAQNIESCIISSMPDQARKTDTVTYSGTPSNLAENLCLHYNVTDTDPNIIN